jgi:adenosylmethionine-8-amino-7-oxononanoate aminotransferase
MAPPEGSDRTGPLWLPYTQMQTALPPFEAVATDGVHITLADGRRLLDGVASWWTACHGYNHPYIAEVVAKQLFTMPHVMFGGLVHAPAARLAERLCALLPGDLERVFFTESGSVAVEVALKMAIQYWRNRGEAKKRRIVAFRHAYHGDTFATMALCDPGDGMHRLFEGTFLPQIMAPLPEDAATEAALDALLSEHRDEVAAVIVEPLVQGAGGMKMHGPETLSRIRALCDRHGLLMIADEIFTGFGRTGRMFAVEAADVVPDIMTLGKALSGGTLPLAATVARRHIFEAFLSDDPMKALMHGPTFMANPLACAAANASLDLFEKEPRLQAVARIEAVLKEVLAPLKAIPGVADIRVKGAIGVVEIPGLTRIDWLKRRFVEEGVWIRPFGDIIYVTPAFIMEDGEVRRLAKAMLKVIGEWAGSRE